MIKNVVTLGDGTPLHPDYLNFHDKGRLTTTKEKRAIAIAWAVCDWREHYSIAAATPDRVVGGATHASAKAAAEAIAELVRRSPSGSGRQPTILALVANFYPDEAETTLIDTDAEVYLATEDYPATDVMQEEYCIDRWTGRNIVETDRDDPRKWKEFANRRVLIQPRFQLLGIKRKRGPR